jgi:murein L,D-transpeptidase YcbB/YkuD
MGISMDGQRLTRRGFAGMCLGAALAPLARAENTNSIGRLGGQLATQTEVIAEKGEPAMLSLGSLEATRRAAQFYGDIARDGGWAIVPEGKLNRGKRLEAVLALRQRLAAEAFLTAERAASDRYDEDVEAAVKAFQRACGLPATGRCDQATRDELNIPAAERAAALEENLPRIQAHLEGLGPRYILVNVPAAQLEAVNFGTVYSRHNVVAGKRDRPTPAVNSKVSEINFNPYWNVPESIVRRDMLPKLIEDPYAMDRMRIRIFDGQNGPEIDPTSVDWTMAEPDRFFFRQDPGGDNAMASVKINFANKYHVYMHDTPAKSLFKQNARYESSGCVRVDQVHVLVDWILRGQDGVDISMIEEISQSGERLDIQVRQPPDVRFMYLTAWASENGRAHFRPDVYGLAGTGFVLGEPLPLDGI